MFFVLEKKEFFLPLENNTRNSDDRHSDLYSLESIPSIKETVRQNFK